MKNQWLKRHDDSIAHFKKWLFQPLSLVFKEYVCQGAHTGVYNWIAVPLGDIMAASRTPLHRINSTDELLTREDLVYLYVRDPDVNFKTLVVVGTVDDIHEQIKENR